MSDQPAQVECKRCRQRGPETYRYIGKLFVYDVDAAWRLVKDGREPVELERESVEWSVHTSDIDDEHVGHVDASIPGLIAHLQMLSEDGEPVKAHRLIDGHHRAARCLREERPFFAYLLTEEESEQILLSRPQGPMAGVRPIASST
jgi:hypothetical protein